MKQSSIEPSFKADDLRHLLQQLTARTIPLTSSQGPVIQSHCTAGKPLDRMQETEITTPEMSS